MPLTRNLYREDEVVAALISCCVSGRNVEAAFWCQELIDSQMIDELIAAMRRAWLYGVGVQCLGWLRAFQECIEGENVDADRMLQLVQMLSRAKKDRTILTILAAPLTPDRVTAGKVPETYTPLERFTALAIHQRRVLSAWAGARALTTAFLKKVGLSKHGVAACKLILLLDDEGFGEAERLATTVAALCLTKEEFQASWTAAPAPLLREVVAGLTDWAAAAGRARRAFSVPASCLYYFTERGRKVTVYETTEKEIMGRLEKPGALWGSSFWDSIADWEAVKSDAATREAFYDEYFPDDRPDEWSKADRAKSHGPGPLQPGAVATVEKAMDALIGRLPCMIWGALPPVQTLEWSLAPIPVSWNLVPVISRSIDVV
jgi:hypothetical protein